MSYRITLSFLLSGLLISSVCFARQCESNIIEVSDQHLSCLQENTLSKVLTESFIDYRDFRKQCLSCKVPFIGATEYAHLFDQKHMAVAISPNGFGGQDLYVIFRNNPMMYKFWFYEVDKNKNQLRLVSLEKPTKAIAKTIDLLQNQDKYWKN